MKLLWTRSLHSASPSVQVRPSRRKTQSRHHRHIHRKHIRIGPARRHFSGHYRNLLLLINFCSSPTNSMLIRTLRRGVVLPPLSWSRRYSIMAPGGGGAAAISASSKHPFDIPSSSASGPLGAIKDPAAGPNSRPEMEGGVTSSSSPVSGSAPGSSSSKPAASPPPVATSGPTDPARGPSSTPLPDQSLAVETPTPSPAGEGPTAPLLTTMVETPSTASPRHQHPFNTYAFVSRLEAAGVRPITARTLMEGVRSLTVARSEAARARVLSTEELDNVGR